MKKKLLSYAAFLATALPLGGVGGGLLTSCNDFLEVDAPSAYTPDFVFSQKTEIERALNGVYTQALVNDLYGQAYQLTFNLNSDVDVQISSASSHSHTSYTRFDCDAQGGEINKFWTAAYQLIEYANKFIASAEASQFITMPEGLTEEEQADWAPDAQVLQWVGEAKCLRAMVFHDLVVMFGDVPLKMQPTKENEFVPEIVDRTELQKALIEDLKKAAPYMSSTKDVTVERCSKEFAQALIARIALTAGGYSLRPNKSDPRSYGTMERPDNWKEFYQIARDYADSVITAGTHSLRQSYQDVFVNECNYQVINDDDPIFEIPFAKNSTGNTGYIQGPSYASYESKTVGPWGEVKGNVRLNAFYRFMFRDNDQRREFVNGMWYYTYKTNESGTLVDSIVINKGDYSVYNNKWSKLWTAEGAALGNSTTGATGINFPYMRYADVLLMYAETANELNDGPTDKAVDCLTQVHARAFEDGDPAFITAAQADKATFQKAVLDERKWEFAGENSRWRDLVRTNTYAEEIMYCFLRYYSVGMQSAQGLTGYEDAINEHDGYSTESGYIDNLPSNVYFHKYQIEEVTPIGLRFFNSHLYGYVINSAFDIVQKYPNQSLPSLRIYNAYASASRPVKSYITQGGFKAEDWMSVTFYEWGDNNSGTPKDQCKYSFYGFMRSDDRGNIWIIRNGVQESFSTILTPEQLPVVRYILPYPNLAVQRSNGQYKNYYGYNN